jgi:transposase
VSQKMRKKPGTWRKYSPAFRQQALERMAACSNISELARELGVRRKWLYEWREDARAAAAAGKAIEPDPALARLQKRVAGLERLIGRQTAEIDFFKGALRKIKERRQLNGKSGGTAFTSKSAS